MLIGRGSAWHAWSWMGLTTWGGSGRCGHAMPQVNQAGAGRRGIDIGALATLDDSLLSGFHTGERDRMRFRS